MTEEQPMSDYTYHLFVVVKDIPFEIYPEQHPGMFQSMKFKLEHNGLDEYECQMTGILFRMTRREK